MSRATDAWHKPPFIANPLLRYGVMLLVAVYLVWSLSTLPFDWERISDGVGRAARIFSGAFPPSFARHELMLEKFLESLQIALLATACGVILSVPIALASARNLAPMPVYVIGRGIFIVARSFHPLILALLFVKAVGFGPMAGVFTLIAYAIGFVAKMLAERIEEIDHGQVEAVRAAGAGYLQTLIYGVLPQVMPRLIGLSIYQLDSNLRASAVIGIVGAGGIGSTLANAFGRYDYDFALAIIMVIVGVILFSEAVSGYVRRQVW
ncbi:MAG: phosphonate ABC transporter, permease protein PhnE [Kiloniellales bacterium]